MRHPYTPSENELSDSRSRTIKPHLEDVLAGHYAAVLQWMKKEGIGEREETDHLRETYRLLCLYYARGAEDPSRQNFLIDIGRRLMTLLRQTVAEQQSYSRLRARERLGVPYSLTDDLKQKPSPKERSYYDRLDRAFDYLWTSDELTEEDLSALRQLGDDEDLRHVVLSGLFVGAMEYFDIGNLRLLGEILREGNQQERSISMASLLMLGRRYQTELLRLYPDFVEEVSVEIIRQKHLLQVTVEELFNAYSTERNDRIFAEEVLPKLQDLGQRLQGMPGGSIGEQVQNFYEVLDQRRDDRMEELLSDAVGRMGDLQRERFDMEYSTVKNLKRFPFFQTPAHWFYPFMPDHPDLNQASVQVIMQLGTMLFSGRVPISSDLYSFALIPGLDQMVPAAYEGWVPSDHPGDDLRTGTSSEMLRDFIFGAYRFYHLYDYASDFVNPFVHHPFVLDGPFTRSPELYTEEELCDLAVRVAHDGHYRSAGYLYERARRDYGSHSGEVWRGIAVVCIMEDRNEEALRALQSAIAEEGVRAGTAEKVASLLVNLGRKGDAITFIEEVEDRLSGSSGVSLVQQRMELLRERGDIEAALQAAYKADYLADGTDTDITAALCELLLRTGDKTKAEEAVRRAQGASLPLEGIALIATGERSRGITTLAAALAGGQLTPDQLEEALPLLSFYDFSLRECSLIHDTIVLRSEHELPF